MNFFNLPAQLIVMLSESLLIMCEGEKFKNSLECWICKLFDKALVGVSACVALGSVLANNYVIKKSFKWLSSFECFSRNWI